MARLPFAKSSIPELPESTGVYIFLDEKERPLYVGKATSLRDRARSYFGGSDHRLVSQLLKGSAHLIEYILTGTVKDALILENSLIKKHKPRLNIRLKDDKTYFSLRLDPKSEWPRLTIVRRRKEEDVLYFGPYTSANACRRTIQHLNSFFPLRTCPDSVLYNRSRPCLAYEIGRCVAPCVGLTTKQHYAEIVDRVIRFLSGRDSEVLAELEAEMQEAASALEFERAAEIRDRLEHMRKTIENPTVARRGGPDRDVIGLAVRGERASFVVLQIRDGQLTATSEFRVRVLAEPDLMLESFLGQYYVPERLPPSEILLPSECQDLEIHREVLVERRGSAVEIRVPERGEGLKLLRLAEENAEACLGRSRDEEERDAEAGHALQERLGLVHIPQRIECFDISHLGGEQVVGSGVSFEGGRPDKARYRHYRLREVQRNDDFAAMEEVLRRRLKRGLQDGDLPDLVVIDGGRSQLARVVGVMKELQIDQLDVIGLAKAKSGSGVRTEAQHERVYLPDSEVPIVLQKNAKETLLLARIRDEAHRFAITYSRKLRAKEKITSVLELVPGLGRRRVQELLKAFGSVAGVRSASREDLLRVKGMSEAAAMALEEWCDEHPPVTESSPDSEEREDS